MKEVRHINNNTRQPVAPRRSMTLNDIYYILFRQKWLIFTFLVLGVVAAGTIFAIKPPMYESEAKLLIRYVQDNRSPGPVNPEAQIRTPEEQGANLVGSEVEILTSFDLALQVADGVGPERILAKNGGGRDRIAAAGVVSANLLLDAPNKGSVIHVAFRNSDPDIVQPVLNQVIENYLKAHVKVHLTVRGYDELQQQTDQLRDRLAITEQALRDAKQKAGVISLDETKKGYAEEIIRLKQRIFDAQADLVERKSVLTEIGRLMPVATNTTTAASDVPVSEVEEYRSLTGRLEVLWKHQQDLLMQYTEDAPMVKRLREQIADAEKQRKKMETANPRLMSLNNDPVRVAGGKGEPSVNLNIEYAKIRAEEEKVKTLNSQIETIHNEVTSLNSEEGKIYDLERKKQVDEQNWKEFNQTLNEARFNETIGQNKYSNISVIQYPSPPYKDTMKTMKLTAGALIGCLMAGLALAFLSEIKLDSSVKRAVDIESKLNLPLFLTIPHVKISHKNALANGADRKLLNGANGTHKDDKTAATASVAGSTALEKSGEKTTGATVWSRDPALNPYYEALRDRIILDFEIRNLTHTPKLIAVTGCNKGAGVTTVALGLAASLSETGAGNVLLVDMNRGTAAAQQFYKGKTVCGLDEALQVKDSAQVHNNLYVVSETPNGENVPHILPRRFTNLVPKLRASDYDYIIFDMPPVSPTSVTPRIAGFMDQVLLVVESEKTDREIISKATDLLSESKASVSAVLNKTRAYVPKMLHKEF